MGKKQSLLDWEDGKKSSDFWLATWFGAGLVRPAPGTWGSLAALPLGYGLGILGAPLLIIAIVLVNFLGERTIDRIEAQSGIHDAPEIVIDEVVGQWIALLPIFFFDAYSFTIAPPWVFVAAAFILFRFFDIVKPWPIGVIDKHVTGGRGVMADDLAAGSFAAAILFGLNILLVS